VDAQGEADVADANGPVARGAQRHVGGLLCQRGQRNGEPRNQDRDQGATHDCELPNEWPRKTPKGTKRGQEEKRIPGPSVVGLSRWRMPAAFILVLHEGAARRYSS